MISFIVIGKNEGWRLIKCLESIHNVIKQDNIIEYEIIYVDSKSTDESIENAKKYGDVKVFLITGKCNAAIARNIGAKEAKGNILFFIDGDMEILSGFLSQVIKNDELVYPFISGICIDYNYDDNWDLLNIYKRNNIDKDNYEVVTGGLFIIEHRLWDKIKGMDTRFTRSQDFDLGLRLAKKKYPLLRKSIELAKHHTISYSSDKRFLFFIFSSRFTALLTRKHFFNKNHLRLLLRTQYSSLFLLFCLFLSFYSVCFLLLYPMVAFIRTIKKYKEMKLSILKAFLYFLVRDTIYIISLFSFFVRSKQIKYIKI